MKNQNLNRREFIAGGSLLVLGVVLGNEEKVPQGLQPIPGIPENARWGFLVDPGKCIGCGRCTEACREENSVPTRLKEPVKTEEKPPPGEEEEEDKTQKENKEEEAQGETEKPSASENKEPAEGSETPGAEKTGAEKQEPEKDVKAEEAKTDQPSGNAGKEESPGESSSWLDRYRYRKLSEAENTPETLTKWRTWVERYLFIETEAGVRLQVDAPGEEGAGYPEVAGKVVKGFFVPKLCNHCFDPSCVKVCPINATYVSPEGVVLVDQKHCFGCGYCVQACPYNMRYIDHRSGRGVADKCTWCYHRIKQTEEEKKNGGEIMKPACVTACPTGARAFGDLRDPDDPVTKTFRTKQVYVIRPDTGNDPQVRYAQLSREVK